MSQGPPPPGFPALGARIQAVRRGRPHELIVETYETGAGLRRWAISADPELARWVEVFHSAERAESDLPIGGDPFALLVRARLEGARIAAFEHVAPSTQSAKSSQPAQPSQLVPPGQPEPESLRLSVESAEGVRRLVLELHRPHPNALLLDESDRVLGLMRPAMKVRPIVLGEPLPPLPVPRGFADDPPRVPARTPKEARALDLVWRERLAEHDLTRMRVEGARLAKQATSRLDKRLAHLEQDRQAAAEASQYERWGELLKIHGYRWRPGMAELRVPDEFVEGRPEVGIALDPALSLADNIASLFRQYRKRQGAEVHVRRRMADAQRDLSAIHAAAEALAGAVTLEEATQALGRLSAVRTDKRPINPPTSKSPGAPKSHGPLERTSSDGLTVLVGRSAEENDSLTFRIAKGRDWWLHAQGFPGSHVVVRNPAGGALPPTTLREAAWLAGYFSKARNQGEVEVGYVERKHVRRVPKGKPGQVTYAHGKTLWIDIADARLRKILGATEHVETGSEPEDGAARD